LARKAQQHDAADVPDGLLAVVRPTEVEGRPVNPGSIVGFVRDGEPVPNAFAAAIGMDAGRLQARIDSRVIIALFTPESGEMSAEGNSNDGNGGVRRFSARH